MGQLENVLKGVIAMPASREITPTVRRTTFAPEFRSINEQKRTLEIVSSTERVDRYGDVLVARGFRTGDYMKAGGPILWSHDAHSPSIAKTLSIGVESNPNALVQTIEFATKDVYPFADTIWNLYREKFLTSFSVGFRPLESEPIIDQATGRTTGFTFLEMDLIEVSAVPAPANPDCVARAISSGLVTKADAAKIFATPEVELHDLREEIHLLSVEFEGLRREVNFLRRVVGAQPGSSAESEGIAELERMLREGFDKD